MNCESVQLQKHELSGKFNEAGTKSEEKKTIKNLVPVKSGSLYFHTEAEM